MKIIEHPSANFDERQLAVSMIVLHYTETKGCAEALYVLCDASSFHPVSAHWLIDRDGTAYRLVDESKRAWHAGVSYWDGITDCNSASVGIELVNDGAEAFPMPQMETLAELCAGIRTRHDIRHIVGHSDIAPDRKRDPGPLFPWDWLRKRLGERRPSP